MLLEGKFSGKLPIHEYFYLTEKEAAVEFEVCLTSFKKICRARGLSRWPHRKVSAVDLFLELIAQAPCHIIYHYRDL